MTKAAAEKAAPEEVGFEEALKRLTGIVNRLESGELSLEQSLALFEEGTKLARASQARLDMAEKRVEELLAIDARGEPNRSRARVGVSVVSVVENAAFLAIGNELLTGKVAEANLLPLAKTLRALGIELRTAEVLLDHVPTLAGAIARLSAAHGLLVTSGGVGPTHDDVTIEAVASAFGRKVLRDPTLVQLVKDTFRERTSEAHLRFADIPEGAVLRKAPDVDWPTPVVENVWILPGVPEVFRMKLSTLRSWVRGPTPFLTRAVLLARDEVELKEALDAVVEKHRTVTIGSYPALFNPRYRTRITFDATSEPELSEAHADLLARLPAAWIVEGD